MMHTYYRKETCEVDEEHSDTYCDVCGKKVLSDDELLERFFDASVYAGCSYHCDSDPCRSKVKNDMRGLAVCDKCIKPFFANVRKLLNKKTK